MERGGGAEPKTPPLPDAFKQPLDKIGDTIGDILGSLPLDPDHSPTHFGFICGTNILGTLFFRVILLSPLSFALFLFELESFLPSLCYSVSSLVFNWLIGFHSWVYVSFFKRLVRALSALSDFSKSIQSWFEDRRWRDPDWRVWFKSLVLKFISYLFWWGLLIRIFLYLNTFIFIACQFAGLIPAPGFSVNIDTIFLLLDLPGLNFLQFVYVGLFVIHYWLAYISSYVLLLSILGFRIFLGTFTEIFEGLRYSKVAVFLFGPKYNK